MITTRVVQIDIDLSQRTAAYLVDRNDCYFVLQKDEMKVWIGDAVSAELNQIAQSISQRLAPGLDAIYVQNAKSLGMSVRTCGHVATSTGRTLSRRLFCCSHHQSSYHITENNPDMCRDDLDSDGVYLLDDRGETLFVWNGKNANLTKQKIAVKAAAVYVDHLRENDATVLRGGIIVMEEGKETFEFINAFQGWPAWEQ